MRAGAAACIAALTALCASEAEAQSVGALVHFDPNFFLSAQPRATIHLDLPNWTGGFVVEAREREIGATTLSGTLAGQSNLSLRQNPDGEILLDADDGGAR